MSDQYVCGYKLPLRKLNLRDCLCIMDADKRIVFRNVSEAEADYFCKAVNCHDKLLTVCRYLSKAGDEDYPNDSASRNVAQAIPEFIKLAKEALAEADK